MQSGPFFVEAIRSEVHYSLPSMHDETLTELLLMLHQVGIEKVLVGVVFAHHLLHDRRVQLIANVIEVVGFVLIANFTHSNSPILL